MQYLTYDKYIEIGGVLDLPAFNRNIDRACGFVDRHTSKRIQEIFEAHKTVSNGVMCCVRDLVEYIANNYTTDRAVTGNSQSAGGVSESENYLTKSAEDMSSEMYDIVCDYLWEEVDEKGTPLMYRGCVR